jgi:hypothetical protein
VLLPVVSMMTFGDAQKQENRNRCKFFPADKLSLYLSAITWYSLLTRHVASQKWDRIKVVCSQPFVKETPIGV